MFLSFRTEIGVLPSFGILTRVLSTSLFLTILLQPQSSFFLIEKKISELSIFAISRHNVLNRNKKDLENIYEAQIELYKKWGKDEEMKKAGIRFSFVGDKILLPKEYQQTINELENNTKKYSGPICNLLTAYDGQWDLIQATKKAGKKNEELNEEDMYKYLEIQTPIDLVIRTGKEKRLSGCPLYQMSYAELVFKDYFYPELTVDKLKEIYDEFIKRERRFGK